MGGAGGIWDGTSDTWSSIGVAGTVRKCSEASENPKGAASRLLSGALAGLACYNITSPAL
jgi:hypothetical protein